MSCPMQHQFINGTADRLREPSQVQPPVGKFSQAIGSQRQAFSKSLFIYSLYHIVIKFNEIGMMRALIQVQNRMQEHKP